MKSWVRWLVVVCWHTLLFHFSFSHSLCHTHDKIALLQFKTSLNYSHSGNVDTKIGTWENGTDCCSWVGVTCHPISGRVIGIDVSSSGLFGAILSNNTLFHLSHLQSLNLASNFFFNFQLSSLFDGLVSLKRLNLSNSFFIGEIPSQISQLSKLESLDLSNNMLTWKESSWKKFLQNVTFLRELILDHVDMTLSSMSSLNLSTSLVSLSLESTSIQGNLKSDILCLPKLEQLHLSDNSYSLNGQHLPSLSCSGASLTLLDLSSNHFEGSIPVSFSNLTHLTFLDLSYNIYLNGSIPSSLLTFPSLTLLDLQLNQFSGQIPNVFPQSNSFEKLDLSHNNIEGELPSTLSNLQHLIFLDLSKNKFSGQISSSISNLQQLIHLDLSYNEFKGQIPSSLSNLQHLVILDLSENEFSGQIPSSISNFHNLTTLILAKNELRGQIPSSLLNLQHLIFLNLAYNRLEGPLPNKITGLPNLTDLHLNDNLLNGTIPVWCLSLPSLLELDLSDNRFTGHISAISSQSLKSLYLCNNKLQGSIPPSIFSLVNLTGLCLSSNNFSGLHNCSFFTDDNYKFPHLDRLYLSSMGLAEFPKLSGKVPMLAQLDLSNNKLNGTLPEWLQEMNSLLLLNLSQNMLIDPMNQLSRNSGLLILDLSFNLLTGGISSSICNVSSLLALILSHNKLTGGIPPCLTNLKFLAVLDLQRNKLNGTLPSNFSMDSGLGVLNLNDNQLEGILPKSLSNCSHLEILNLGNNQIEDKFPYWLQTLPMLAVLVLRVNKFYGPIPSLEKNHGFSSLLIFDISSNYFSGPIPKTYLQNFQAMKNVTQYTLNELYMNQWLQEFVSVTTKAISMTFNKIPKNFVIIDLSRNKFEGEIPYVIGELRALKGLNFSHNRLGGLIPKSIGNLTNLESLDLSSNMFTGRIPIELANMNFLGVLNLSCNNLVGEIPQGKHLDTFSNDSYLGNSGLCGFPLSMKCNNTEQKSPSSNFRGKERFGFGWEPVVIGYGCGMLFGIGLGFLYCRKA
ncbi:receptor-like protein 9DC3 [Vigna angularis]|uniref:receptor-like protein 9DC3 n=1 Tax=Phaseolus angularis TaxID=3914 RepID=UPI00080A13A4|nr:receptor-like protein 9DC3 [Vigna angularis]